jgi:hypothetical protein
LPKYWGQFNSRHYLRHDDNAGTTRRMLKKGRPARQQEKGRSVLFLYGEPLNAARTKLADFFSILQEQGEEL